MRDWISTKLKNKGLNINVKEISLTGSGRIGQSLAPKKLGQTFTEQVSDLDIFVISGLMFEEVKNKFNLWDKIEIVSPSWIKEAKVEKIFKTTLNHWTKKAGTTFTDYEYKFDEKLATPVDVAHGWGYEVWINMDQKPEDFSLIRKEI